jgi:hypothetical protein
MNIKSVTTGWRTDEVLACIFNNLIDLPSKINYNIDLSHLAIQLNPEVSLASQ